MRFCVLMRSSPTSMMGPLEALPLLDDAGPLPFCLSAVAASAACSGGRGPAPLPLPSPANSLTGAGALCCFAAFFAMNVALAAFAAARAAAACSFSHTEFLVSTQLADVSVAQRGASRSTSGQVLLITGFPCIYVQKSLIHNEHAAAAFRIQTAHKYERHGANGDGVSFHKPAHLGHGHRGGGGGGGDGGPAGGGGEGLDVRDGRLLHQQRVRLRLPPAAVRLVLLERLHQAGA